MQTGSIREVAVLFLRLGCTAFGGPAAHVALLEDEVVGKRGWVSRAQFLDLLSACNVIPGPNSTELAIHLGYRRAGWAGLVVAGVCFIVPAVLIVWVLAWAYVRFGARPEFGAMLRGMQPVVLAVVLHAMWRLGQSSLRSVMSWVIALGSVVVIVAGVHELVVLAGAALVAIVADRASGGADGSRQAAAVMPGAAIAKDVHERRSIVGGVTSPAGTTIVMHTAAAGIPVGVAAASAGSVFLSFAKIGSVLFGSGYVLLAFLRSEFVERNAWLTDAQVIDAIIVGQITPGPVFTTATFVGYLLAGNAGAVSGTLGIFLPAFVFVAVTAPMVEQIRRWRTGAAALTGLNAASLALMAAVVVTLSNGVLRSPLALTEFVLAAGLLFLSRIGAGSALLAGAVVGIVGLALASLR